MLLICGGSRCQQRPPLMYRSSIERKHECRVSGLEGWEDVAQPGSSPPILTVNGPFVQPQHRCIVVGCCRCAVCRHFVAFSGETLPNYGANYILISLQMKKQQIKWGTNKRNGSSYLFEPLGKRCTRRMRHRSSQNVSKHIFQRIFDWNVQGVTLPQEQFSWKSFFLPSMWSSKAFFKDSFVFEASLFLTSRDWLMSEEWSYTYTENMNLSNSGIKIRRRGSWLWRRDRSVLFLSLFLPHQSCFPPIIQELQCGRLADDVIGVRFTVDRWRSPTLPCNQSTS